MLHIYRVQFEHMTSIQSAAKVNRDKNTVLEVFYAREKIDADGPGRHCTNITSALAIVPAREVGNGNDTYSTVVYGPTFAVSMRISIVVGGRRVLPQKS